MKQSKLFLKTQKESPKDEESVNAQLLLRASFIDKLMAGSYTLLPLARRVLSKINTIIREELNDTGAEEMLMPLMHPRNIWDATGRWDSAQEIMFQLEKNKKEYALSFTHEEVVMDIIRKQNVSYKDLPIKLYHFSTKFRNEPRPRSGLLRGIEFLMNDLYSLHTSKQDMQRYYTSVKEAYVRIFNRCGLQVKVVDAPGGVFTNDVTHEFQVLSDTGEDTIFWCNTCDWAQNKELSKIEEGSACPSCEDGEIQKSRSIEVGNIFPLGKWYAEKMGASFTDEDGQEKPFWFASYGIGTTRLIGTIAEVLSDSNGLVWPVPVAPYHIHLLALSENTKEAAEEVYNKLKEAGVAVLFDEREEVSAGEKLAEADLLGIPFRLVVSEKTLAEDSIEFKPRTGDEVELISKEKIVDAIEKKIKTKS